jgi:hypothetical protein
VASSPVSGVVVAIAAPAPACRLPSVIVRPALIILGGAVTEVAFLLWQSSWQSHIFVWVIFVWVVFVAFVAGSRTLHERR